MCSQNVKLLSNVTKRVDHDLEKDTDGLPLTEIKEHHKTYVSCVMV